MKKQTLTLTKHSGKSFDVEMLEGHSTTKQQVRLGFAKSGNEWYEIKTTIVKGDKSWKSAFCYSVKGRYATSWFQLNFNKVKVSQKSQAKPNHLTI